MIKKINGFIDSHEEKSNEHKIADRSLAIIQDEEARFNLNTGITVSNGELSAPIGDRTKYLYFGWEMEVMSCGIGLPEKMRLMQRLTIIEEKRERWTGRLVST